MLCYILVSTFLLSTVQLINGAETAKIDFDFWEVNKYFVKVIGALDKLTWYLQEHYHEGNLDLFIGTRIAEGQLSTLLERASGKGTSTGIISAPMTLRLQLIRDRLTFVSERGAQFTEQNEPQYFKSKLQHTVRSEVPASFYDRRKVSLLNFTCSYETCYFRP